jgi:hypothetical protein
MQRAPKNRGSTSDVWNAECPLWAFLLKLRKDCRKPVYLSRTTPLSPDERFHLAHAPFPPIRYFGRKYAGGCESYDRLPSGQVVQLRERDLFGMNSARKPSLRDYEGE